MSWLWSTTPETNEANPDINSSEIAVDPYASGAFPSESLISDYSTGSRASDSEFGSAFSDEFDTSPTTQPQTSFDIYAPTQPSASFGLPIPSDDDSKAVDFSTMGRIDPSILSPRSQIGRAPSVDYVFAEDYREVRKKSGAEQLTYLAGMGYLSGAVAGGAVGATSALRSSGGKPLRLRVNALLNGAGKSGSRAANTMGVLALAFSLSESAIYNYTNDDSIANYAFAGAAAGALYKSTRGVRLAGIWALGGMAVTMGGIWASRNGYYGRGLQGIL